MRLALAALVALLSTAVAAEEFTCGGPFAPDTSHERLAGAFGADNVLYGEIWGPEGTFPLATVVFPEDPARRLSILWRDDDKRATPLVMIISEGSGWTVSGLRTGMGIAEVEALNGKPFSLGGFDDIGRGLVDSWEGGKLTLRETACSVNVEFGYDIYGMPTSLEDPLNEQGPFPSDHPTYRALGARIDNITISFPTP